MERADIEKTVVECVATAYGKDAAELSAQTEFAALGGSSLQMVGLASNLENELDVMLVLQDVASCKTIGELVDKAEAQL